MNPENQKLTSILAEAENIAVVGLSDDPSRTSHRIAAYMQEAGYRVIPINPRIESALGEKAYSSLGEVTDRVDIVNVFRRSEEIPALADEAIERRPRAFWMQKGISNPASARRLEDAGITTIQDLCIKTAHRELTQTPR
ncbi:MAG: CoA-binding protein [Nitrospinae bacterium]|nr:CoA-binding protein [Nitrospinota bacterium]